MCVSDTVASISYKCCLFYADNFTSTPGRMEMRMGQAAHQRAKKSKSSHPVDVLAVDTNKSAFEKYNATREYELHLRKCELRNDAIRGDIAGAEVASNNKQRELDQMNLDVAQAYDIAKLGWSKIDDPDRLSDDWLEFKELKDEVKRFRTKMVKDATDANVGFDLRKRMLQVEINGYGKGDPSPPAVSEPSASEYSFDTPTSSVASSSHSRLLEASTSAYDTLTSIVTNSSQTRLLETSTLTDTTPRYINSSGSHSTLATTSLGRRLDMGRTEKNHTDRESNSGPLSDVQLH
jgi:hypothetical protein